MCHPIAGWHFSLELLYSFINIKWMFPAGGNDVTTFQGKTIAIQMADIRDTVTTRDADHGQGTSTLCL